MMSMNHMQNCFVLMIFVDLTPVSIKDRRSALTPLLDTFGDNTIIIIGKCFKSVVVLADVTFRLVGSLFHKTTQTASADASDLRMKNLNIVYKRDNGNYMWIDPYICQLIKEVLFSKLEFCIKRFAFLEFDFSNYLLRRGKTKTVGKCWKETFTDGFLDTLAVAGPEVWKEGDSLNVDGGHTLPVFFEKESDEKNGVTIKKTCIVCEKDSNYERPLTPNYGQTSHDGKNKTSNTPEKRTSYYQFSQYLTRLATLVHCNFFTDRQTFARLGFFYKGQGDKVCCYECGVTLSDWRKDDDPLLEHIRYSPECRHLSTVIDPTFLASCKGEFQQRQGTDSSYGATGVTHEKHLSHKKIRSPEYSSHSVRLSTFARFPVIPGVNIHIIAAAGFYYTGHEDTVRCYACDGGLKTWVPGDDPWEEHYKWFPDCPHLKQANYKPSTSEANANGSDTNPVESTLTSAEKTPPSEGLVGKLDKMTTREEKKRQEDPDPDMNTPAALAVMEHGYSKQAVKMVINELRKKGSETFTANGILDILLSYQEKGITLPTDEIEKPDLRDVNLERKVNPFKNELTEEMSLKKISNTNVIAETKDKELGLLLEENKMLTLKMMCKRCRKKQRNILVLPCTHFCLCDQCSMEISLCPECWKPIKERVRTYIS